VALSEARWSPVELGVSRVAWGSGRGSEKRRDDCSRRAVGELYALDMMARGCDGLVWLCRCLQCYTYNILGSEAVRRSSLLTLTLEEWH
jgi:hypothetical protein